MKKLAVIIGVLWCCGFVWMQQYQPVASGGAPADLHWIDPYSTNSVGYAFFADGQSGTNVTAAYGSIGSMVDNAATNGVPVHNVVTNDAGITQIVVGTNALGDVLYAWNLGGNLIQSSSSLSLCGGVGPSNDISATIYFWYKLTNAYTNLRYPINKASEYFFAFDGNPGSWALRAISGPSYRRWVGESVTNFQTLDVWWFMTATMTASNGCWVSAQMYTNGALYFSGGIDDVGGTYTGMTNCSTKLQIGPTTYLFNMTDVGILKTNLSASEVAGVFTNLGGWKVVASNDWSDSIRAKLPLEAYP